MKHSKNKIKVAISCGDINGVGLEVVIKSFLDPRMFELCTPIIYGNSEASKSYRKNLGTQDFSFHMIENHSKSNPKKVNLVTINKSNIEVSFGAITSESGQLAYESITHATDALASNHADVLVTAPIHKQNINWEDENIKGHTEYLANYANEDHPLMMMVHNSLRVGVVTGHVPLKDVSSVLTKDKIVNTLEVFRKSLVQDFNIHQPKIAVLGLNPHAGDSGVIGREEEDMIIPAIEQFNADNNIAIGPFASDGFFGSGQFKKFDGILAMYHDQGLIPFKTISNNEGVNFTAGLPIVRTSPDHGTAFDIAGKNTADPTSFRNAIFLASDIFRNRKTYRELTKDVLKIRK
ncbi:MAG: 4-hydroxythreonine-4-phosphate dehydrogenase PdxA [Salibacteraceae bacterium]